MKHLSHKLNIAREWINKTDVSIGIVSFITGTLFIILASTLDGLLHDLLISLSASIYSVGFTIATVDGLRKKRRKDSNSLALENAYRRISGSNTVLAITLAVHVKTTHRNILVNLIRSKERSLAHDQTMIELSEIDGIDLLKHFPEDKIETDLARALENVSTTLDEIYSRYSYLLDDEVKSGLNKLIEYSDAAAKMAKLTPSFDKDDLNKIFVPTDPDKNNLSPVKASVLSFLSSYLEEYAKFVKTNINQ